MLRGRRTPPPEFRSARPLLPRPNADYSNPSGGSQRSGRIGPNPWIRGPDVRGSSRRGILRRHPRAALPAIGRAPTGGPGEHVDRHAAVCQAPEHADVREAPRATAARARHRTQPRETGRAAAHSAKLRPGPCQPVTARHPCGRGVRQQDSYADVVIGIAASPDSGHLAAVQQFATSKVRICMLPYT